MSEQQAAVNGDNSNSSSGFAMKKKSNIATSIYALVHYHGNVSKVKLQIPEDLGKTKLFSVIKSVLQVPQDHPINIARYSKTKQSQVYLSSQAEFSALWRCATVKKRFTFTVTDAMNEDGDKEDNNTTNSSTVATVDSNEEGEREQEHNKPVAELSDELISGVIERLKLDDRFNGVLDELVQRRIPSNGDASKGSDGSAFDQAVTGVDITGWPVDSSTVICNGCEDVINKGERYKCATCIDFDLCVNCISKRTRLHNSSHEFYSLSKVGSKKNNIPHHAFCDGCSDGGSKNQTPITGIRYKCLNCDDYDLCDKCINDDIHHSSYDHSFVKVYADNDIVIKKTSSSPSNNDIGGEPFAHNAICDICDMKIFGNRYKCLNCDNFDLCSGCFDYKNEKHTSDHSFVRVRQSNDLIYSKTSGLGGAIPHKNWEPSAHNASCDNCNKRIIGIRYRCDECNDYDLCENCFSNQSKIHPIHAFLAIQNSSDYHRKNSNQKLSPTHQYIYCDGPLCNKRPTVIKGVRYKCVICNDADFCEKCESSPHLDHDISHPLIKMKVPYPKVDIEIKEDKPNQNVKNPEPEEKYSANLEDFTCHANGCLTWVYRNVGTTTWPRYTSVTPKSDEAHQNGNIRWTYTPFATSAGNTVTFTAFTDPGSLQNIPTVWLLKTPGGKEFGERDFSQELSKILKDLDDKKQEEENDESVEGSNVVLPMLPKESPSSSIVVQENNNETEEEGQAEDDNLMAEFSDVDDGEDDDDSLLTDDGNFEVVELSELSE